MSSSPSRSNIPIDKVTGNIKKEKNARNPVIPSDASTLILISPDYANNDSPFEYRTLLLQRSSKSSFMPNACVFPGGKTDDADFSDEWRDLFSQHLDWQEFLQSLPKSCSPRCHCYCKPRQSSIPADVGLRICAIRETFEESGVLLLRDVSQYTRLQANTLFGNVGKAHTLPSLQLNRWRKQVHENAFNFLTLCRDLNALPDVWSLYEWSNWVTPKLYPKRFDTAFFVCCTQGEIDAKHDQAETTDSYWSRPIEALKRHASKKIFLPPPQIYELSRLCNFRTVSETLQFATHRAMNFPTKQYLPVHFLCKDGLLSLLPGDSLYPENELQENNLHAHPDSQKSISELRMSSVRLNRVEYEKRKRSNYVTKYFIRVAMGDFSSDGHKQPYLKWQNMQSDNANL